MYTDNVKFKALKCAFPHTIPIFLGFWFLSFAYGVLMNVSGFSFWYPFLMSIVIFGGSLEFVTVNMLLSPFAPLSAFVVAIMLQARHLFYGISMLDKYKGLGWKKIYLIYGMCDETFSVNYTAEIPDDIDKGWFYFWVTLLNQFYWVSGALIGGLVGGLFPFSTKGLDFVMTAMFVVIFLEEWRKEKTHIGAFIGFPVCIASLLLFGPNAFVLPAMIAILLLFIAFQKPIEKSLSIEEKSE